MSDWYGKSYERDAMDRSFEAPPMSSARPREYDVVALIDFLVDPEGRETRYYAGLPPQDRYRSSSPGESGLLKTPIWRIGESFQGTKRILP